MKAMRRHDREITDPEKIARIMEDCHCCRLGFCDEDRAYIVPLNFGHAVENGKHVFYFHSAQEGRKIDLIRRTGRASFEMDTGFRLNAAEQACGWSAAFQSIIGEGAVTFVEAPEEKRRALDRIMAHYTGKTGWDYPDGMVDVTCIFRLEVEELACKEHE